MTERRRRSGGVRWGQALVLLGLICAGLSIFMAAWPGNFLARLDPEWLNPKDPSTNLLGIIPSALIIFMGALVLYNNKPIPEDEFPAPQAPKIEQNEAWRPSTGFRYLEKLKEHCTACEKQAQAAYGNAIDAYRKIPVTQGFIEYKMLRTVVNRNVEYIKQVEEELPKLKDQITKVFGGDVRADVLDLEEEAEKLKLTKQHRESEVRELDQELRQAKKNSRDWLESRRDSIRDSIKAIEIRLVEITSSIKELREFDFQRLYGELGVSPESMRLNAPQLSDIKTKAQIVSEIKPQVVSGSQKKEDEEKMAAAAQRIRHDIKFDVQQRLGRRLTTLEEIQGFYRSQSEAIKNNSTLSYDEKTEQLDQLSRDCEEYKRELKSDVEIYEED